MGHCRPRMQCIILKYSTLSCVPFFPPTIPTELSRIHPESTPFSSSPVAPQPSAMPQHNISHIPLLHSPHRQRPVLHSNTAVTHHSVVALQYVRRPGTVWSRRQPAVRRSSPPHPRSWQAPSRVSAGPEGAKRFTHTVHMLYALSNFADKRFSRYTIICYSIGRWPGATTKDR